MLQSKQSLSPQGLNNLKKYVCSFCTKKFLSKSALKAHTKFIHQHINIFECPYENCDKYFNTQYRLDIHKLIHKGIKPYKCDLCEKTFTEQGTLRTHLVTHSMVKPFKCELCDYTCKTNPQMRHHYKKEHNDENYYKCPKCLMKFNKKAELKRHFNEHISYLYGESLNFDNICNKNIISYTKGENSQSFSVKDTNESSQTKQYDTIYQIVNEIQFGVYVVNNEIDI